MSFGCVDVLTTPNLGGTHSEASELFRAGREGQKGRHFCLGLCKCPLDLLMCELLNELFDLTQACNETKAF